MDSIRSPVAAGPIAPVNAWSINEVIVSFKPWGAGNGPKSVEMTFIIDLPSGSGETVSTIRTLACKLACKACPNT